jgi:hypothetical protein
MKTRKDELDEMVDVVVKLVWSYKILRALFEVNDVDYETRKSHPEFFMTMHDSLLCLFCTGITMLFDDKEKATSLRNLIKKSQPQLAKELMEKIQLNNGNIRKIEAIRHQVFAHRFQAKSPRDVFDEVKLQVGIMGETAELTKFIIYKLAGEIDPGRKDELEKQQLSQSTIQTITSDVAQIMQTFPKTSRVSTSNN